MSFKVSRLLNPLHLARVAHAKIRNAVNAATRPSAVTDAQRKHVRLNPECAACGSTTSCQGHHIKPYHKFPGLAADPSNFITLCEEVGGEEHHLRIGHGSNFKFYVASVVELAASCKAAETEVQRQAIYAYAKSIRAVDEPAT